MTVAISGPVAFDQLMRFEGRFAEQLLAGSLDSVSLSFLTDDMCVRRGGVGGNIAYGLAQLGLRPLLVGMVGADAADYVGALERAGVDTRGLRLSESRHTARYVCTTDAAMCQISSFYVGAAAQSHEVSLGEAATAGHAELAIIAAGDPRTMREHTRQCRDVGIPFVADPAQQIALLDGPALRELIEGAAYLVSNEYEFELLRAKTGLSAEQLADLVGIRVTTLGARGVEICRGGADPVRVPVAAVARKADPTGTGDAFRAGFFAARHRGLSLELAAQVGSALAATVLEVVGPQDYTLDVADFRARLARSYGTATADAVDDWLRPAAQPVGVA
ncbi:carbohydrate kinase family protein [Catellatospora chokoriensis]|uniref:Adenosine kinase n=1 Tax=Catellatospora chokoriensis TaxID=310353 RepID=A0A8J3K6E2_9ACTN|nr:carbohydrate kinase family protein [Catellatospora chokoriensis]GIF90304.1 adenosine kinase [Catellatospora chokoriensis]